ncbi:MAG: hypothetical protein ACREX3_10845 [Gammaproteobacteria bacterium]
MVTVTYRHSFSYRDFGEGRSPVLQLRISPPNRLDAAIDVDAHLDSGADSSLFDGYMITAWGMTLINDNLKHYGSTLGGSIEGYLHNVRITVPEVGTFDLQIGFSSARIRRNLLGRDFFALTQIGFRERQLEYYLTPAP